jgi:hypothetical protein
MGSTSRPAYSVTLGTRGVVPLLTADTAPLPIRDLKPVFDIKGTPPD